MNQTTRPVKISSAALSRIREIINEKNIPSFYGLRVGIEGGGCTGMSSNVLGFDTKNESDIVYTIDDLQVYIDKRQVMFLAGTTIDYIQNEEEEGFTFEK